MKIKIETETFFNGQKWREIPYVNGQRHGIEIYWHFDGLLGFVTKWNQDQKVWEMNFSSQEQIPEDVEVELFFHEIPEFT